MKRAVIAGLTLIVACLCDGRDGSADEEGGNRLSNVVRTPKKNTAKNAREEWGFLRVNLVDVQGKDVREVEWCAVGKSGRVDMLRQRLASGETRRLPTGEIAFVVVPSVKAPYYAEIQCSIRTNELTDLTVQLEDLPIKMLCARITATSGEPLAGIGVEVRSLQYKGVWSDGCSQTNGLVQVRAVGKGKVCLSARGVDGIMKPEQWTVAMEEVSDEPIPLPMRKATPSLRIQVQTTVGDDSTPMDKQGRLSVQIQDVALTNHNITRSAPGDTVTFYDLPSGTFKVTRVTIPYPVGATADRYEYLTVPIGSSVNMFVQEGQPPTVVPIRIAKWPEGKGSLLGQIASTNQTDLQLSKVAVVAHPPRTINGLKRMEVEVGKTGFFNAQLPAGYYDIETTLDGKVVGRIERILVLPGRRAGPLELRLAGEQDVGDRGGKNP